MSHLCECWCAPVILSVWGARCGAAAAEFQAEDRGVAETFQGAGGDRAESTRGAAAAGPSAGRAVPGAGRIIVRRW